MEAGAAWESLEVPARRSLELAWEALGADTVPVGAVVVDPSGAIVAEGRNRIFERSAPLGELAGHRLAHAEVNALVQLDLGVKYWDHTLYTSLEPCNLCIGAALMSTLGRVVYLGVEAFRGAAARHRASAPLPKRPPFELEGPREDELGVLAEALAMVQLVRDPMPLYLELYRELRPQMLDLGEALNEHGLFERAAAGVPLEDVLPGIWPLLG